MAVLPVIYNIYICSLEETAATDSPSCVIITAVSGLGICSLTNFMIW